MGASKVAREILWRNPACWETIRTNLPQENQPPRSCTRRENKSAPLRHFRGMAQAGQGGNEWELVLTLGLRNRIKDLQPCPCSSKCVPEELKWSKTSYPEGEQICSVIQSFVCKLVSSSLGKKGKAVFYSESTHSKSAAMPQYSFYSAVPSATLSPISIKITLSPISIKIKQHSHMSSFSSHCSSKYGQEFSFLPLGKGEWEEPVRHHCNVSWLAHTAQVLIASCTASYWKYVISCHSSQSWVLQVPFFRNPPLTPAWPCLTWAVKNRSQGCRLFIMQTTYFSGSKLYFKGQSQLSHKT